MPVYIWSIGVLLMLLLFLQYKNVTVAIASSKYTPLTEIIFESAVSCLLNYNKAVYKNNQPTLTRNMI